MYIRENFKESTYYEDNWKPIKEGSIIKINDRRYQLINKNEKKNDIVFCDIVLFPYCSNFGTLDAWYCEFPMPFDINIGQHADGLIIKNEVDNGFFTYIDWPKSQTFKAILKKIKRDDLIAFGMKYGRDRYNNDKNHEYLLKNIKDNIIYCIIQKNDDDICFIDVYNDRVLFISSPFIMDGLVVDIINEFENFYQ